jgi:hypothetical protein
MRYQTLFVPLLLLALALAGCPSGGLYDSDGDGSPDFEDCDPQDPEVRPGPEDPVGDGLDQNCDGVDGVLDCDADDDGVDVADGELCAGPDCDDLNASVYPGADELCDGIDTDCDGQIPREEVDGDGDGDAPCQGDCDDLDGLSHPGATELCDGIDNDCDGDLPEEERDADDDGQASCAGDCDDTDGSVDGLDRDGDGFSSCLDDCDDHDDQTHPGADGVCSDGVADNDCDGATDHNELDQDADGVTPCGGDCDDYDPAAHAWLPELCDGLDNDCDAAVDDVDADGDGAIASACGGPDCDDADPAVHPAAVEVCDGLDNDCAPGTDEEVDGDGDGFGLCDGDCDDGDILLGPSAAELCDGADNDCDGVADESCVTCDATVPGSWPSIQAALDGEPSGSVVCVDPGTWIGDVRPVGEPVHLLGVAGAEATIVQGDGADSVLVIDRGDGPGTIIEKLTITGGHAPSAGGGILVDASAPTLRELVVTGNTADGFGGGVGVLSINATLLDVVISGNSAPEGGGLAIDGSAGATLVGCTVSGNQADRGGGIHLDGDALTLDGVLIEGNDATYEGGGLYANSADLDLQDSTFVANTADGGGGLWLGGWTGTTDAEDLLLLANVAVEGGGAMIDDGQHLMTDVIVEANVANRGAGIRLTQGSLELSQSTISANEAWLEGGGLSLGHVAFSWTGLVLDEVVISDNEAAFGGGLHVSQAGTGLIQVEDSVLQANTAYRGAGLDLVEEEGGQLEVEIDGSNLVGGLAQGVGGGAAVCCGAWLELTDTTVQDNVAVTGGGGLWADDGAALWLTGVTVADNAATGNSTGGGLHLSASWLEAEDCSITGNSALDGGGGYFLTGSQASLSDCTVADNTASRDGGGLLFWHETPWVDSVDFSMDHVAITGNSADRWGGGVRQSYSDGTATSVVVAGNTAMEGGGWHLGGGLSLAFAAIVGNEATGEGGGLYRGVSSSADPTLTGVVITDNIASNGGGIYGSSGTDQTFVSCDVYGNTPSDFANVSDPTGSNGNLSVDPAFLDTSATDPADWDLHLQATSPLVGAGPGAASDPDGSPADIGAYGGPDADGWDLDGDGAPLWWMPGSYQAGYPASGWDCDDTDPAVGPTGGC